MLTLHNIPHDLPTIFLHKNRMETILQRILSGINLVALAIRRTHILRFTTHSWRQLGKQILPCSLYKIYITKYVGHLPICIPCESLRIKTISSLFCRIFNRIRCHFIQAWRCFDHITKRAKPHGSSIYG